MTSAISKCPIFSVLDEESVSRIGLAAVFGYSESEAIFITKDDEAFGLGSNKDGCLGLENKINCQKQPKKIDALSGIEIKSMVYGYADQETGPHVVALTESGRVFAWGTNKYYQLGNGSTIQGLPTEVAVLTGLHVVQIACGNFHTLALTSDGEVFAWGMNGSGQIGSGTTTNQQTPMKVITGLESKKVISIACCSWSSMALLENGELYTWGCNSSGELGLGNTANQFVPTKVNSLTNIHQLACGYSHVLCISGKTIYVWGLNKFGQLGTGDTTSQVKPVKLNFQFKEIAASGNLSVGVGDFDTCWVWGLYQNQSIVKPLCVPVACSVQDVFAGYGVTWKPINISSTEKRCQNQFSEAFDNPKTSDLKFVVEGKTIHVHKAVLKIQCQHFRTMFNGEWSESGQVEIKLDSYSYPVYHAFLKYLYTNRVNLPPDQAINLLDLANSYLEDDLKKMCENIIRLKISTENVASVYEAAISFESKKLKDFCLKFILDNLTAVVKSDAFSKLNEENTKDLFVKVANQNLFKT